MSPRRTSMPVLEALRLHARRAGGTAILCSLLIALIVYGLSGSLVTMLGGQHQHGVPASAAHGEPVAAIVPSSGGTIEFEDFRRLATPVHPHDHVHAHADLERHHHDRGDVTVIALGGDQRDAGAAEEGSTSGAPHVLAIASASAAALPDRSAPKWAPARPPPVDHWIADDMERPPKA